jgi:predicted heme/steroid binding protein
MHNAGKDLIDDLEYMSPHGADVLERFPVIGMLGEG